MKIIRLPTGIFEYDSLKPLGKPGGFGQVFLGKSPSGMEVAIKKLHLSAVDAAHRELRIADELKGRSYEHVVPFIDSGEDADTGDYFVVMPRAEGSLQNKIENSGALTAADAVTILHQIVKGLIEVGELVHRDLKPDNVLFHEGKWKIADFGIARFIQDATASNTLKGCMSPHYAAPEQWRYEHATHATDVYALGCIAFCLLTGQPPFTKDPQAEHQSALVPSFNCAELRLKTLINMCLGKAANGRPSLSHVHDSLTNIITKPQPASSAGSLGALAAAAAHVSTQEQEAQARKAAARIAQKLRTDLAQSASERLANNAEQLWEKIRSHAANATRVAKSGDCVLDCRIGNGQLKIHHSNEPASSEMFPQSGWDVVAHSKIIVIQHEPSYCWSASLWFVKMKGATEYRWYEASYWRLRGNGFEPFAMDPGRDADLAAACVTHTVAFAFGPVTIDNEQEDEFHNRWIWLLTKAIDGKLRGPSRVPFDWPPQLS